MRSTIIFSKDIKCLGLCLCLGISLVVCRRFQSPCAAEIFVFADKASWMRPKHPSHKLKSTDESSRKNKEKKKIIIIKRNCDYLWVKWKGNLAELFFFFLSEHKTSSCLPCLMFFETEVQTPHQRRELCALLLIDNTERNTGKLWYFI